MNAQQVALYQPTEAIARVDELMAERHGQMLSLFAGDETVVDRMRTLTLHALTHPRLMEKLQRADLGTVIEAVRDCAALGLMPIPALAEGYFVPYWNSKKGKYDIQFQPGYNGLAKLVRNSGHVLDVSAGVAYEGDQFDYDEGSSAFVRHKRALRDRGNRIASYAIANLPGGLVRVRVMDMAEIEQHRRASKAADDGPWVEWYDAMSAKTALRDLCKYLPKSATVERALIIESEAEERHGRPPATGRPSATVARIHDRLGISSQPDDTGASEAVVVGGRAEPEGDDSGTVEPAAQPSGGAPDCAHPSAEHVLRDVGITCGACGEVLARRTEEKAGGAVPATSAEGREARSGAPAPTEQPPTGEQVATAPATTPDGLHPEGGDSPPVAAPPDSSAGAGSSPPASALPSPEQVAARYAWAASRGWSEEDVDDAATEATGLLPHDLDAEAWAVFSRTSIKDHQPPHPPKPRTDAYRALDAQSKANARAYWSERDKEAARESGQRALDAAARGGEA